MMRSFYNTMWLIANDVIIGGAVSTFFCENSEYIGRSLGAVVQVSLLLSSILKRFLRFPRRNIR